MWCVVCAEGIWCDVGSCGVWEGVWCECAEGLGIVVVC